MPADPQPQRPRRRPVPATRMAALAVAGIAADPAPTTAQQVLLIAVIVIATLSLICDVAAWRLERADPQPTAQP